MTTLTSRRSGSAVGVPGLPTTLVAIPILTLLLLPLVALLVASSPRDLIEAMKSPLFLPALALSARTTAVSLGIVVVLGTPLAWWLGRSTSRLASAVEVLVDLPIVIPPAVMGIALLQTFGRRGLLGGVLTSFDVQIPFTIWAVILAQVVVSAPFYVQAAAAAFRSVDSDLLIVARTLGQSPLGVLSRVAIPMAAPGVIAGAALAWARGLGEFGATLIFAGNLSGTTQTMPLAIYVALESDVRVAIALSLVLAVVGLALLLALRGMPRIWLRLTAAAVTPVHPAPSEADR